MNDLSTVKVLPTMSLASVDVVSRLAEEARKIPQVQIKITHVLHAGTYARTAHIPAGVMITGVLIKIPTILIVSGECLVYIGDDVRELRGYNVLSANAHRKQVFIAKSDTDMTMFFASSAKTVEEAEEEFTNEYENLFSRDADAINHVLIGNV